VKICHVIKTQYYYWISRFKRSSLLAPDRQSHCMWCKMFRFPCPTTCGQNS